MYKFSTRILPRQIKKFNKKKSSILLAWFFLAIFRKHKYFFFRPKRDSRFGAASLWNNLPLSLKNVSSEKLFNNKLKMLLSERLQGLYCTRPLHHALYIFLYYPSCIFVIYRDFIYRRPALLDSNKSFWQPAISSHVFCLCLYLCQFNGE